MEHIAQAKELLYFQITKYFHITMLKIKNLTESLESPFASAIFTSKRKKSIF